MSSIAKGPLVIKNSRGEAYMIIDDPKTAKARWEREAKNPSPLIASAARANLDLLNAAMATKKEIDV